MIPIESMDLVFNLRNLRNLRTNFIFIKQIENKVYPQITQMTQIKKSKPSLCGVVNG